MEITVPILAVMMAEEQDLDFLFLEKSCPVLLILAFQEILHAIFLAGLESEIVFVEEI